MAHFQNLLLTCTDFKDMFLRRYLLPAKFSRINHLHKLVYKLSLTPSELQTGDRSSCPDLSLAVCFDEVSSSESSTLIESRAELRMGLCLNLFFVPKFPASTTGWLATPASLELQREPNFRAMFLPPKVSFSSSDLPDLFPLS